MNSLLEYVTAFWKLDDTALFTPNDQALYYLLLKKANEGRWQSAMVELDNRTVMVRLKLGRYALEAAQEKLMESRLIKFTQGNGRGKVSTYEILPAKRVQFQVTFKKKKGAVSSNLSPVKGAVSSHLYWGVKSVKVQEKVVWNCTLYTLKPAVVATFRAPKIIDTIVDTVVSTVLPREAVKKSAAKKPRKVTGESPCYTRCIDLYNEWYKSQSDGFGAKIDGTQGGAMKSIITYLRAQVTAKALQRHEEISEQEQETRVVEIWSHVLNHTHLLSEWLKGQTRLVDFNSNFQNILVRVRDELIRKHKAGIDTANQTGGGYSRTGTNGRGGGTVAGLQGLKRNGGVNTAQ